MNSRYYNQSINKYINGEPHDHLVAKYMIAAIAVNHGYEFKVEANTDTLQHYRTDVELWNIETRDFVGVNVDGGYHQSTKIQIRNTNTRDFILKDYYCGRYVVISVEEVHELPISEITKRLGIE